MVALVKNITVISKPLYPRNRHRKLWGKRIWTAGGRAEVVVAFGSRPLGCLRGIECSLLTMPGTAAVLLVLLKPLNGYRCISGGPPPASDPAQRRALPPTRSVSGPCRALPHFGGVQSKTPQANSFDIFFPLYSSFRNIMPPLVIQLGRCYRVQSSFSLCL